MRHAKHTGSIITAALLCLLAPFTMSAGGAGVTSSCVITSPNKRRIRCTTANTPASGAAARGKTLIWNFKRRRAKQRSICTSVLPRCETWSVETETDGEWRTLLNGSRDYMHVLLEVDGQTHFGSLEIPEKRAI